VTPSLAVGYDAILAVDPSIYTITDDADGRAWAFEMGPETREDVADAVEQALVDAGGTTPQAVEDLAVEPGYVRVRYEPPTRETSDPQALEDALRSVPSTYNDRHATAPDLDGLAFDRERSYLGSYRPDDASDREAFLARYADGEDVPESDGPVFTHEREDAGESALVDARRFAYRFTLPFDASAMYDPDPGTVTTRAGLAVEWDRKEVRERLELIVGKLPLWPGGPENTPLVAVYPGYLVVEHYTDAHGDPVARAETVRDAILRYNQYRPVDEERGHIQETTLHPEIGFQARAHIQALDHGTTGEEWIREQSLDAVDGEAVEPDPTDDVQEDGDGGGVFDVFG
jgi:hypothetical protein